MTIATLQLQRLKDQRIRSQRVFSSPPLKLRINPIYKAYTTLELLTR